MLIIFENSPRRISFGKLFFALVRERIKTYKLGILKEFLNKIKKESRAQLTEHAVIIHFRYGIDELDPLHQLERVLEKLISEKGVGVYDGHEIAMDYSDGFLYMYGPNAEELFKAVQPMLEKTEFMKGAIAHLRFGPPEDGVREIEVKLMDG